MFYKKYVDICNPKSMFNFLHDHFRYYTANSWNGLQSIAHNVKLYNLGLDGDWCEAYKQLEAGDHYDDITVMIEDWESEHKDYVVGFSGRSNGYLVLYKHHSMKSVLPDYIMDNTWDEFKADCNEYGETVSSHIAELREYTSLVRSFDRLCDDIRDYVNHLSVQNADLVLLEHVVDQFNNQYEDDLEYLDIDFLSIEDGKVNLSSITILKSLVEAFTNIAVEYLPNYKDYLIME